MIIRNNSHAIKTGLIIQGPLYSPGYGPYEFKPDGSFEKSWIEFDCKQNLLETIQSAKMLFDHIVLATWHDPKYADFINSLAKYPHVHVIELKESPELVKLSQSGVHKYHQVETLRTGAAKSEELGCDVVAKIRTDHSVNLGLLSRQVKRHRLHNENSLGVPNINLFELDRLTDFFFVGRPEVIKGMCDFYLSSPETSVDTHRDYFLGFLHFLSKDEDLIQIIRDSESILKRDIKCVFAWTNYYYPLRSGMFRNFYWRGRGVNHRLNGWIRWFYAFHASRPDFLSIKFGLNLILILLVRQLKKPTIKYTSAVLFRVYRRKASRSSLP